MKIYRSINVYDAALERIRFLFDEFPNVIAGVSGGKDSTVVFNLCLQVAKEKNRLPLRVMFLDQEAEWQATIEQIRTIMYHPDVAPLWYQIPIILFNATSTTDHWLHCWGKGEKWMREQEEISIKENTFGTVRFAEMFGAIIKTEPDKTCYISGVRTEESPARFLGLTSAAKYKWVTWGKTLDKKKQHFTFYPIYDWSYTDVWKAILTNGWEYNRVYDYMYNYGIPVQAMRVSNVHHETAVHSLFYMQEFEADTYQKLVDRIQGIDMAGKMGKDDFFIRDLPFMFTSWKEYRDFILEKLITDEKWKSGFKSKFEHMDKQYSDLNRPDDMYKVQVSSILTNDWEFIKIDNWTRRPEIDCYRKHKRGKKIFSGAYLGQIKPEQRIENQKYATTTDK